MFPILPGVNSNGGLISIILLNSSNDLHHELGSDLRRLRKSLFFPIEKCSVGIKNITVALWGSSASCL